MLGHHVQQVGRRTLVQLARHGGGFFDRHIGGTVQFLKIQHQFVQHQHLRLGLRLRLHGRCRRRRV